MTLPFALPAIALPPGVALNVRPLWETVSIALLGFIARFGAARDARFRNDPPSRGLAVALIKLRRLERILRCVFVVYAKRALELDPAFGAVRTRAKRGSRNKPSKPRAGAWRIAILRLRAVRGLRYIDEARGPQPTALANATPNPMRLIATKMEGLRRALTTPDLYVRRMARKLSRTIVMRPRVLKPPRRARVPDFQDDLFDALQEAAWALHPQNTS